MSGHSKWHNIQAKKGKADAAKGRIFTKLGREIAVAAKGGADPATNSKLADVIAKAKAADAVLMGSIGGDTTTSPWYKLPPQLRPEAGLLALRKALNLFANLRPAVLYKELAGACPLKEEISSKGFDIMIMRELTNIATNDLAALTVSYVLRLGALYLGLRLMDGAANYYMAGMGHVMGTYIETDMRRDAYAHLQKLSDTYYSNTKVGQIMGRITNDLFDVTEFSHHCPEEFFIAFIKAK